MDDGRPTLDYETPRREPSTMGGFVVGAIVAALWVFGGIALLIAFGGLIFSIRSIPRIGFEAVAYLIPVGLMFVLSVACALVARDVWRRRSLH